MKERGKKIRVHDGGVDRKKKSRDFDRGQKSGRKFRFMMEKNEEKKTRFATIKVYDSGGESMTMTSKMICSLHLIIL